MVTFSDDEVGLGPQALSDADVGLEEATQTFEPPPWLNAAQIPNPSNPPSVPFQAQFQPPEVAARPTETIGPSNLNWQERLKGFAQEKLPEVFGFPAGNIREGSGIIPEIVNFERATFGDESVRPLPPSPLNAMGITPESVPSGANMSETLGLPLAVTETASAIDKTLVGLADFLSSPQGVSQIAHAAIPVGGAAVKLKWLKDMIEGGFMNVRGAVDAFRSGDTQALRDNIIAATAAAIGSLGVGGDLKSKTAPEPIAPVVEKAAAVEPVKAESKPLSEIPTTEELLTGTPSQVVDWKRRVKYGPANSMAIAAKLTDADIAKLTTERDNLRTQSRAKIAEMEGKYSDKAMAEAGNISLKAQTLNEIIQDFEASRAAKPLNPGGSLESLSPELQAKSNAVKDAMAAEFEKLKRETAGNKKTQNLTPEEKASLQEELAATQSFFDPQSEAQGLARPSTRPTVEDVRAQRAEESAQGKPFTRETGKPTTALENRGLEPLEYIPETEAARTTEAQRLISQFGDDLGAAIRSFQRPPEMSGIPNAVRVVAGEQIARAAAAKERAATNPVDADYWATVRRDAHQLSQAELSQAGQALQSGAQIQRAYLESAAGTIERAEKEFAALKDLDKNFPDLSKETKEKIYDLANKAEELGKLTEAEKAGKTAEQIAELERQKEAFTSRERLRLKTQIEVELAREKLKNGWRGWLTPEGRKARAKVMNEVITANLLTTPTFLTKQPIDVLSQYGYHLATRALTQAIQLPREGNVGQRAKQFSADLGNEVISSLKDVVNSRQAAMRYGLEGLKGRGSHFRDTIGFSQDMKFLDRAEQDVAAAFKENKPWKAIWPLYLSTIKVGLREARFLDELSGTMVENVEIRQMVEKELRDSGATPTEARTQAREAIGNLVADYALADKQAQMFMSGANIKIPKSEYKAMVWDLAHQNALERIRALNLNPEAIEAGAVKTGRTFAWNEREIGSGPGGATMGAALDSIRKYLEGVGVPSPFTAFANAISIGSNRALTYAGGGFFPRAFKGSPFYETPKDITQRKIEAAIGLGMTGILATLAYNGNIRVRNRLSTDPNEREKEQATGRKWGTVEINTGDGKFIPISMNTGPLAPFRVQLSAIGALQDLAEMKTRKAAKATQEAASKELTLEGELPDSDASELVGVVIGAAATGAFGGRTLGGLQGSFVNPDQGPNLKQPIASAVKSMVPLLPATISTERLAGVDLDQKRASLISMILPSTLTGADEKSPRLNDWGEPVTEQNAARVVGILTGNTVPWAIGDVSDPIKKLAIQSGWSPPTFTDKLFEKEGEKLGKLSDAQRIQYLKQRGELLKAGMISLIKENPDLPTWPAEDIKAEFQGEFEDAKDAALENISVIR